MSARCCSGEGPAALWFSLSPGIICCEPRGYPGQPLCSGPGRGPPPAVGPFRGEISQCTLKPQVASMWLSQRTLFSLHDDVKKISLFVPSYRAQGMGSVRGGGQGKPPGSSIVSPLRLCLCPAGSPSLRLDARNSSPWLNVRGHCNSGAQVSCSVIESSPTSSSEVPAITLNAAAANTSYVTLGHRKEGAAAGSSSLGPGRRRLPPKGGADFQAQDTGSQAGPRADVWKNQSYGWGARALLFPKSGRSAAKPRKPPRFECL